MYKFRTMIDGAEALRQQLQTHNEAYHFQNAPRSAHYPAGQVFCARPALRRTAAVVERVQRRTACAATAAVGGIRPDYRAKRRCLSMKPGITGIWQCHGRSLTQYEHLIGMDLEYVDHWSLWLDITLLIKLPVVLRCIAM